jgi:hypothetical protein
MSYLMESRPRGGGMPIYRRIPHLIAAYRTGSDAILAGEEQLRFLPSDITEWNLTEAQIRQSMAAEEAIRQAYARAGLPDPHFSRQS